jgi:hypothetical protein
MIFQPILKLKDALLAGNPTVKVGAQEKIIFSPPRK